MQKTPEEWIKVQLSGVSSLAVRVFVLRVCNQVGYVPGSRMLRSPGSIVRRPHSAIVVSIYL
jgi:hypothetical protein